MPNPIPFKQFLKKINALPDPKKHKAKDFIRYVDDLDNAIDRAQFQKMRFQLLSRQNRAIVRMISKNR